MLFNSYQFILAFLPMALLGYFVLARIRGAESALAWLTLASLFFYGWWNPIYLLLLLASMAGNFMLGGRISSARSAGAERTADALLAAGVIANLAVLGYFKYARFAVENVNIVTGATLPLPSIVLPLAISFFTFQQIAYIVDARRGLTSEYKATHYALFVTFFPQLIAGPIVHHREMLPQFLSRDAMRPQLANLCIGGSFFAIGLFKKVVLADGVAKYATPVFAAAQAGQEPSFFVAWGGALAYTMQLYFDFSGYSDMAIGGARLFGVRLPLNFNSPYKATNIGEFWRRWHMTLSRFLRDYVYIPLGGNRAGPRRRNVNLMVTMLLGGLWHGAGWTFVIWGGLHGIYLVVHQLWVGATIRLDVRSRRDSAVLSAAAWAVTFLAVVVGWVFFRAESLVAALRILEGMAGVNGVAIPNAVAAQLGGVFDVAAKVGVGTYLGGGETFIQTWLWLLVLLPVALWMPNTQQVFGHWEPAYDYKVGAADSQLRFGRALETMLAWRPSIAWAALIACVSVFGLLSMSSVSEFLYFQF